MSKPGSSPALLKQVRGEPSPKAPAAESSACPDCSLPLCTCCSPSLAPERKWAHAHYIDKETDTRKNRQSTC